MVTFFLVTATGTWASDKEERRDTMVATGLGNNGYVRRSEGERCLYADLGQNERARV